MKKTMVILSLCFLLVLASCKKNSSPTSSDGNSVDWEGHYPSVNIACADSILCASTRYLGTSYAPSVYILYKDGSGMRALTTQWFTFAASWSPRRWKIIYVADTGSAKPAYGLFIMNSDGSNKKRLSQPGESVFGTASWSPDGNTIAYIEIDTSNQYGQGRVKLMNPDGTDERILTNWYLDLRRVSWSPDSRRVVFDGGTSDKIYIVNVDGSGLSQLFNYSQGCYSPSWSPDGNTLAFSSFAIIDSVYYSKIFTYGFNTGRITQVTNGKTFDYNPTWSSDSKTIVFQSSPPGVSSGSALYQINVNGSNQTQLTDNSATDYDPSWYK